MDGEGHRSSDPRAFHPLIMVKCTPFRAAINEILIDDKTTVLADQLSTFIVMDKLSASALRANGLGMVFSLFFMLLDAFFEPVFERFPLILENF